MLKSVQRQKRFNKLLQLLKAKIFQELTSQERQEIKQQLTKLQLNYQDGQLSEDHYQVQAVSLLLARRRSPVWSEQFLFYHASPFLSPATIFAIVQNMERATLECKDTTT